MRPSTAVIRTPSDHPCGSRAVANHRLVMRPGSIDAAHHPTMEARFPSSECAAPRRSPGMNEVTRWKWLTVTEGSAPVILSMPHAGIEIPTQYSRNLVSRWLARKDTDWWVDRLYDFAPALGVTVVRTAISRSIVDPNRDPSGGSLYPGQATTELCPTTSFDG